MGPLKIFFFRFAKTSPPPGMLDEVNECDGEPQEALSSKDDNGA
jgi:hypothetical protein